MLLPDLLSHEMIQQQGKPTLAQNTVLYGQADTQSGCGWVAQLMPMPPPLPRSAPARHWAAMRPCLFQTKRTGTDKAHVSFVGAHGEIRGANASRRGTREGPLPGVQGLMASLGTNPCKAQPLFLFLLPSPCGACQSEPLFLSAGVPGQVTGTHTHHHVGRPFSTLHEVRGVCTPLYKALSHAAFPILTGKRSRGAEAVTERRIHLPEPLSPMLSASSRRCAPTPPQRTGQSPALHAHRVTSTALTMALSQFTARS